MLHQWNTERRANWPVASKLSIQPVQSDDTAARDYVNGTSSGTQTGPYRQTYQHDAFGNMTQRDNRFWSQTDSFTASYTNHRRAGFTYDADGRLKQDDDLQYHYDAAGRSALIFDADTNKWLTMVRDGNGQLVKRVETVFQPINTAYYVRSSVLGGRIVTELNQAGQKQKGYVFAGDQVIAEQESNQVTWRHENPQTGSSGLSTPNGWFARENEPDPSGVNVGLADPFVLCCTDPPQDPAVPMLMGESGGCGSNPNCTTCYLDGFEIGCDRAMHLLDIGAADLLVTLNNGRRISVPVQSFGLGIFRAWNPGSPIDIPHDDDPDVFRVHVDETHGNWQYFSFNFAPQGPQNGVKLPPELTPLQQLMKGLGFGDADTVLLTDKKCRDFFAKAGKLGDLRNLLRTLGENAQYDPRPINIAGTTGKGADATIRLRPPFFANDDTGYGRQAGYSWSPARNRYEELHTSLAPRQYRALIILHEFAHALSLIPSDSLNADPTGQQSQTNDAIIDEKCGKGLNRLPVR